MPKPARAKAVLPKRWQDCEPFVAALKARGYLLPSGALVMSDGVYLYMFELWSDGVSASRLTLT